MSKESDLSHFISLNSSQIRDNNGSKAEGAVIIPALNEQKRLPLTLASVNHALSRSPITVNTIVVDNGSVDATVEIANEFGVIVITESKKGVGYARQVGLESLNKGVKYVFTTDSDSQVGKDWLKLHATALSEEGVVGSYGPSKEILDQDAKQIDRLMFYILRSAGFLVKEYKRSKGVILSGGYNSAFKKNEALEVGGYKRHFVGEDIELMLELKNKGRIKYLPDAIVITSGRRRTSTGLAHHILERLVFNVKTGFRAQVEWDETQTDRIDIR